MSAIDDWKVCNLDELANLDIETLSASTPKDFKFYYLDISSAFEGSLSLPSFETEFKDAPSRARKVVHRHDVLMSMVRPNLKAFAYFDHTDEPCVASTGFAVLTAKDDASSRFLLYSILSEEVSRQIDGLVIGSNYPAINSSAVRSLKILAPPKPEQTKIAEILSTVDRAIAQTEALIAKQQRLKTGLMQDLLTCGIDKHGNLRSEQTHEFKDSPPGRIPVEWEVKRIDELLANVDPPMRSGPFGSALLKEELVDAGVPLLGIDNVHTEQFVAQFSRFVHPKKAKTLKRYYVRPRDIMITIMGTVGRCCVVPDDIGTALSSKHTWTISLDQTVYSPYLACLQINHANWVLNHFAKDEQGGIMSSIKSDTLRSTLLPVPPRDEIMKIEARMKSLTGDYEIKADLLRKLHSLKTALMQDLLTGRKRVTDLLINEEDQT